MEKERRELYIEGVAIHGGPESCAGVREGVGEALAGVRVGWAIEPRNQRSGVPTPYNWAEGNIVGRVRACASSSARFDGVVPFGVEMVAVEVDCGECGVGDLDVFRVAALVEAGIDLE